MKILFFILAFFSSLVSVAAVPKEHAKETSQFNSKLDGKRLAKQIGIRLSKPYSSTRLRLIKLSWHPDATWGLADDRKLLSYPEYPELLCGHGIAAICTARFYKNDNAVILTINPLRPSLPVLTIDQD